MVKLPCSGNKRREVSRVRLECIDVFDCRVQARQANQGVSVERATIDELHWHTPPRHIRGEILHSIGWSGRRRGIPREAKSQQRTIEVATRLIRPDVCGGGHSQPMLRVERTRCQPESVSELLTERLVELGQPYNAAIPQRTKRLLDA